MDEEGQAQRMRGREGMIPGWAREQGNIRGASMPHVADAIEVEDRRVGKSPGRYVLPVVHQRGQ